MLIHRSFIPDPALRPYIDRYWAIHGEQQLAGPITLLPDGGTSVILNLGESIRSRRFGEMAASDGALIVGAMRQGDEQWLGGEVHLLGITFRPGAFAHFHRFEPMDRVANSVQPFAHGLHPDPQRMLTHATPYLDRFYLDRLKPPRFSLVEVVADIEQRKGLVRVDDLMQRHCTTARHLERQFKQQLGITPKEFIGLTRFNHAFCVVQRNGGQRSLMEIAWDCGYYDHAHMANAFQRHIGQPPGASVLSDSSKISLA